jgi:hypothetical protein
MRAYYFWQMQCWTVTDASGRPLGLWSFKTEAEQVANHLTALGQAQRSYRPMDLQHDVTPTLKENEVGQWPR